MIQKLWYEWLWFWVQIGFRIFYKRWQVVNAHYVPKDKPIIYAANHQNAFMDAIAIILTQKKQPSFLVRANIFKSAIARFWLGSLNMMPIYRARDGIRNVAKNDKIIDTCINQLIDGRKPLAIFPEGNHNMIRRVRALQKGIARIAFQAIEKANFDLDLKIVPVGINYSSHTMFRSDLLVNIGEPIAVKKYIAIYKDNPNKAYTELLKELTMSIRELSIDIQDKENYEQIESAWLNQKVERSSMQEEFMHDKEFIKQFENNSANSLKQQPKLDKKSTLTLAEKILGFPIYLWGAINNFLLWKFTNFMIKKVVTDSHFYSSIKLVSGVFIGLLLYLIQALAIWAITGGWGYAVVYAFTLPLFAIFTYDYHLALKEQKLP